MKLRVQSVSMEERDPTPLEYWKHKAETEYRRGVILGWAVTALCWFAVFHSSKSPYRPWGKLTDKQSHAEVLVHRVDPHRVYTCEEDPVNDDLVQGHYAVLDQIEALDAGYTPAGQGYCQ